jgi:hypothetical protein
LGNKKGTATLLVFFLLTAFFSLGLEVLRPAYSAAMTVRLEAKKLQAFYLAASGLELVKATPPEVGYRREIFSLGGGEVVVTVQCTANREVVTATAMLGGTRACLHSDKERESEESDWQQQITVCQTLH